MNPPTETLTKLRGPGPVDGAKAVISAAAGCMSAGWFVIGLSV